MAPTTTPYSDLSSRGNLAANPRAPDVPSLPPGAHPINVEAPPSLSDAELVGRIRTLFNRARSERAPIVNQWRKNFRIMRNRTWTADLPAWMPAPEVPEIRPIIASCVAWVTDSRPEFDLTPAAQPFSPFHTFYNGLAVDMKTAMNASWVTYRWESQIEKMVWDAYQYDIGFLKVGWDPSLAGGLGDVFLGRVDPWSIYPDPQATSMDDMNYIIEARTVSLQELDRRFPGAAAKFDVHGQVESLDRAPSTFRPTGEPPRANAGPISPSTDARYGLPGQARVSGYDDTTGVTLLECWLREHHFEKKEKGVASVYECWRCVCIAGPHVLLNKRADEFLPFPRHPYTRYTPEDLGEFVGQSMVELLSASQHAINHILAALIHNIELTGNPVFVEDTRSGIQRTRLPNRPGVRLTKNAGGTAEWLEPPSLNPLMPQLVEFFIREMERISGLSAMARGQSAQGRPSTDTLDNMLEAGFVRIRLALRNLEFTLREAGELVAAIISEFYTEPRMVSLIGPSGSKLSRAFGPRHFYVPTPEGAIPLRFQILMRAGSSEPTTRGAQEAKYERLFAMGGIDRRALLEAEQVPNFEEILARVEAAEEAGQFQPPGARQRAQRNT